VTSPTMRTLARCEQCSRPFRRYRRRMRFCSRACAVIGRGGPTKKASATDNARCGYCQKSVYKRPSILLRYEVVYCSRACKAAHQRIRTTGDANPNHSGAGRRECEGCGRPFKSYDKTRRFCGLGCGQSLAHSEYLTNARRGLEAEKRCAAELRAKGYAVTLSAGSRGVYDVVAISAEVALLISVKCTRHWKCRAEPRHLRALVAAPSPPGPFRKELWCWVDGHGWVVTVAS
jgi:hypothetical protein